ncbi:hypothetical protein LIA77_06189 [Sarocladium implicatum]|nr:hypothetical protein LIA77_06189 [Sarocladium implicatum]
MPTSTLSNVAFQNIGPLTTTYTAPSSCSTAVDNTAVALKRNPGLPYAYPSCDVDKDDWYRWPSLKDCLPGGKALEEVHVPNDPHIRYHSPGLHCPASWATAGVAVKGRSDSISVTGAFSTEFIDSWAETMSTLAAPRVNPWPNKLASALEAGETAILCCPSGWTVHPYGRCHTNFPIESLDTSTLCAAFVTADFQTTTYAFTYFDETVTATEVVNAASDLPEVIEYHTFILTDTDSPNNTVINDEGEAYDALFSEDVTGYKYLPMVVLVNKGDDGDNEEGDDDGQNNDSGNEGGDEGEQSGNDNDDAGASLRTGLGASLAALGVAWMMGGVVAHA